MAIDYQQLAHDIKRWAKEIGFEQAGITDIDVSAADQKLQTWLEKKYHGSMDYLSNNRDLRAHPDRLVPGTTRIICTRINYLPKNPRLIETLNNADLAYISRYALGRDYHRLIRKKLKQLAQKIESAAQGINFTYRPFADSAPVFEKPLAVKAGLGWMGKNTLVLNREAGSWFFLGTLFTNLPLPVDQAVTDHCGSCTACLEVCPTKAIVAPYQLDARRCISYLTIENKGSIPVELRPLMGQRIFGCDDCQIFCPWNKFAQPSTEPAFSPRHNLDQSTLIELFSWDETTFLEKTQGSAIRRAGYIGWLRNIAVALGNTPPSPETKAALIKAQNHPSALVREHVEWALASAHYIT